MHMDHHNFYGHLSSKRLMPNLYKKNCDYTLMRFIEGESVATHEFSIKHFELKFGQNILCKY